MLKLHADLSVAGCQQQLSFAMSLAHIGLSDAAWSCRQGRWRKMGGL